MMPTGRAISTSPAKIVTVPAISLPSAVTHHVAVADRADGHDRPPERIGNAEFVRLDLGFSQMHQRGGNQRQYRAR